MLDPNDSKRDEPKPREQGLIQSEQLLVQSKRGSKLVWDCNHPQRRRFLTAQKIGLGILVIFLAGKVPVQSQVVDHHASRFVRADHFPDRSCEPSFHSGDCSDYDYSLGLWQKLL